MTSNSANQDLDQEVTKACAANPWLSQVAVIESIRTEIEAVATYELRLLDPQAALNYRFQPGQFNMLYIPGCGESAISHSGSSEIDGSQMRHTIRFVGRVTNAIAQLRVGEQLGIRGPFGTAWPMDACRGNDLILMSGGLGLAPLRPAVYAILQNRSAFGRVVLLHGARRPELLLFADEFDRWNQSGIEVQLTVDQADSHWQKSIGVVPLLLDRLGQLNADRSRVLICGPEVMMHYSAISALRRGIVAESIWLSIERNMQCAVGLCGHCQLGPVFVCKDGPVFRYDRISQLLKTRDL